MKKVFLEISQNSQEFTKFTFARLFFNKIAGLSEIVLGEAKLCEIFRNTFSYRTSLMAAFERLK